MKAILRRHLFALAGILALGASVGAAAVDAYPARPIKVVVGYSAGGAVDAIARSVGQRMSALLGQPVVVENKPGAGTNIAVKSVIGSAPDGYTLLLAANALAVNPSLFEPAPYDLDKDLTPIALVGRVPVVFTVREGSAIKTLAELVAAAKAKPGSLTFASAGQGTSQHLSGETFRLLAGVDITHVPYKGSAPAIQDVMGGQVPLSFETVTVAAPHIASGKVRALAVTSAKRSRVLPNVPTLQEAGVPGFDVQSWQAFYAPAKTPAAIVQRLNAEFEKIVAQPEVKARLDGLGVEHSALSPAQFADFNRAELARWQKVVKEGKVQP